MLADILNGKEALLFDMDGTLIDSMWMWKEIDREYLARFGIAMPKNLHQEIEGISFRQVAEYFKSHFPIDDPIEKMMEDWVLMAWEKYANEVPLKEGVGDFLRLAVEKEIKLGIATSNSSQLTNLILQTHELTGVFQTVKTACEVPNGKPSPDIYLLAAKELGVLPEKCLVFEDAVSGILAGKRAGMEVCAVYDDHAAMVDQEKQELSDYYIHSFVELLP